MTSAAQTKDEISLEEWLNSNFFNELSFTTSKASTEGSAEEKKEETQRRVHRGPQVENLGQIRWMGLPETWVEGESQSGIAGSGTFSEFHPEENPDTTVCFFYRGRPIKATSAESFTKLLCQKPHFLSARELDSVADVIRDKADAEAFSVLFAKTAFWNGKCVLIVEGRYKKYNEDTFAIFVDASGTGWFVQEIYFQSPRSDYVRYRKEAKDALATIEWK